MAISVKALDDLCSGATVTLSEATLQLGDRSKNLFSKFTDSSATVNSAQYDQQKKILTGKVTVESLNIGSDRACEIRFLIDDKKEFVTGFYFYITLPDDNWNIDNALTKINLDVFRALGFSSGSLLMLVDPILPINDSRTGPVVYGAVYFTFNGKENELLVSHRDGTYTLSGSFTDLELGTDIANVLENLSALPLVKETSTALSLPDDFLSRIAISGLQLRHISIAFNQKVQFFSIGLAIRPQPAWDIIPGVMSLNELSAQFYFSETPIKKYLSVELATTGKIWTKFVLEARVRLPELQFSGTIRGSLSGVEDNISSDVSGLIAKDSLKPSVISVSGDIRQGSYDLFISLGSDTHWNLGENAAIIGGFLHISIPGKGLPAVIRVAADLAIGNNQVEIAVLKDGDTWKFSGEFILHLPEKKPNPARTMILRGSITRGTPPAGMSYEASWQTPKGQGVTLAQLATALGIGDSPFDELTEELTAAAIAYHSKDKAFALALNSTHANIAYTLVA